VDLRRSAAIGYAVVSAGVVAFQVALAAGVPWGSYAMGGAFPGQFPPALRVAALVQATLIVLMSLVMLSRAGVALQSWSRASRWLAWLVVALGTVSFVLNVATPSPGERQLWAPVTFVLLVCAIVVATGKPVPES
jgi:hypothetical protein